MKVLVVTNMYPHPEDWSFGTFVHEQVRALTSLGVEMEVLFINGRANRWNYLKGIFQFWRQLRRNDYDLIHAHYVFSGWIARLQRRLPLVVSFHGAGEMVGYVGWLCKKLAPRVDGCTVTSAEHKQQLGYEDAYIIPCGVDLALFKPMSQAEARKALGWEPARKVILWVGDPRPEKRLDIIQAAYEQLRARRPDADLILAQRLPHETIPLYMNAADVLVLASDYEGSPVVIKEAMACNLPIVSVAVGDVAEVIGSTEGCYLCTQTPDDMAEKIERVLNEGRRTKGRDAIQHLQTRGEAEHILALYKEVLERWRHHR